MELISLFFWFWMILITTGQSNDKEKSVHIHRLFKLDLSLELSVINGQLLLSLLCIMTVNTEGVLSQLFLFSVTVKQQRISSTVTNKAHHHPPSATTSLIRAKLSCSTIKFPIPHRFIKDRLCYLQLKLNDLIKWFCSTKSDAVNWLNSKT